MRKLALVLPSDRELRAGDSVSWVVLLLNTPDIEGLRAPRSFPRSWPGKRTALLLGVRGTAGEERPSDGDHRALAYSALFRARITEGTPDQQRGTGFRTSIPTSTHNQDTPLKQQRQKLRNKPTAPNPTVYLWQAPKKSTPEVDAVLAPRVFLLRKQLHRGLFWKGQRALWPCVGRAQRAARPASG
ncbi:hypothetical protein NDU88_007319 [Pleurodeles waltl]|uniref:Uncharacterized protein n=1 Tax=Pleurodeles waltl TaxID=8319 RepID=A0AAV7RSL3_PLEWA|nr:hypothetical protein NDU88_007319 [Pleurodeles waltl]